MFVEKLKVKKTYFVSTDKKKYTLNNFGVSDMLVIAMINLVMNNICNKRPA